jgi:acetolactate synthase-1/2/3 large subunit
VNGVACAQLERAPLIVLVDAHPAAASASEHQRIDQRGLLATVTKWTAALTPGNADAALAEGIQRAIAPPRGPVCLEVPSDVAGAVGSQQSAGGQPPFAEALPRTADWRLPTAHKPLLIAGLEARDHAPAVRAFVRSHRVPAMVTYKAKGVVADRDAWFAGVFTNGAFEQEILNESDLLIAVGLDRVELLPRPWTPRQPILEIKNDIAASIERLRTELAVSRWDFDELQRVMAMQRYRLQSTADGLTPDRVVRIASDGLPHARVTVDAGAHMFPATLLWPVDEPGGMLISNGLSTMGFAVPAAIGAALPDRERAVVALTGDGGLLMCLGELATLTRERLRVVVIVFNDRSLSLIDVKQRARQFVRSGVDVGDVVWADIARGFGLQACAASTPEEFERAVASARMHVGPSLIDARVDSGSYDDLIRLVRG